MISDEALMLEFQRGSREAFEELFARYREPLYGFFRRRLASKDRAEDLAQETFLAVIRALVRYEPRALVKTYLYGIALRLLTAERRKLSGNEPPLDEDHEPAEDGPSEEALWVRQALEKLDAGEREILMLREYEQLNYAEIAELLRLPVNTVRSRLFRARHKAERAVRPRARRNHEHPQSSYRTRRTHGLPGWRAGDQPRSRGGRASGTLRRMPGAGG
jgi:RNA polymerase sigma-70 factor (ECF subfamily)